MGRVKDKLLKLECEECKKKGKRHINYYSRMGKQLRASLRQASVKFKANKHCQTCQKHTTHIEAK